jgi:hypothetical protein
MNTAKAIPKPANVIIPPLSARRLEAPPVDFAAAELVLDGEELVLLRLVNKPAGLSASL